jgi:hypothetical protein
MVYSFEDVQVTLTGIGGSVSMGNGASVDDGGISVDMVEDKDHMITGADGKAVHNLRANKAATVTVRLMGTSPTNAVLSNMYNSQISSSQTWAGNVLTISNPVTGDNVHCSSVAFKKVPPVTWAKDSVPKEWVFNAGYTSIMLGVGI